MKTIFYITIFAVLSAFINGIGILMIARQKKRVEKVKRFAICFAAGMLISTPLILTLPNAAITAEKPYYAGLFALAGFLFMLFSNRFFRFRTKQSSLAFGITAAEGIAIHSLLDGLIYTVTFSHSTLIGIVAATGLVIHEFAEGIITYTFFVKSKMPNKKAMLYSFLVAGLTTPIGAFIAYPFMSLIPSAVLALLLGFVSGVLIYLSAAHLLFEARIEEEESKENHSMFSLLLGVALALVIVFANIFG